MVRSLTTFWARTSGEYPDSFTLSHSWAFLLLSTKCVCISKVGDFVADLTRWLFLFVPVRYLRPDRELELFKLRPLIMVALGSFAF